MWIMKYTDQIVKGAWILFYRLLLFESEIVVSPCNGIPVPCSDLQGKQY